MGYLLNVTPRDAHLSVEFCWDCSSEVASASLRAGTPVERPRRRGATLVRTQPVPFAAVAQLVEQWWLPLPLLAPSWGELTGNCYQFLVRLQTAALRELFVDGYLLVDVSVDTSLVRAF